MIMSLDVTLTMGEEEVQCTCPNCDHPHSYMCTNVVFSANITHNLGKMAADANIYDCVWRPDENGISKASQLIVPLRNGLTLMKSDPTRFKVLNPPNGWGSYDAFVLWLEKYLAACEEYPDAEIEVSR